MGNPEYTRLRTTTNQIKKTQHREQKDEQHGQHPPPKKTIPKNKQKQPVVNPGAREAIPISISPIKRPPCYSYIQ